MRPSLWLGLTAALLLTARSTQAGGDRWVQLRFGPPALVAPAKQTAPPVVLWTDKVEATAEIGDGNPQDAAKTAQQLALEAARDKVQKYLDQYHPDLGWQPTITYLERGKIVRWRGEPVQKESERRGPYVEVTAELQLTDQDVNTIREHGRLLRVQQRHHLAGLFLLGAMALLVVVGGYLRLEEMTRGFYTGLLRLGAVGLLVLAAAGLWLLR